jgi:hypothetical protein
MKPKSAEDVFDLIDAYTISAAAGAALELGLFWMLEGKALTSDEIAAQLHIPPRRGNRWLQLLGYTGLIEATSAGYTLSDTGRKAITQAYSHDAWTCLAAGSRERIPAVLDLVHHLREPESTWAAQGLTPPNYLDPLKEDPPRTRQFTRMLYELHRPLADALAASLDLEGVETLLDVGGGSGVMSLALLRRHPELRVTVVDLPHVCVAGEEIAHENGLADRITCQAADFSQDDLPTGFDRVLLCDVGLFETALVEKVKGALNLGGRLVVVDAYDSPDGALRPPYLFWAFLTSMDDPDARRVTVEDARDRLEKAGYEVLSERPLAVERADRWTRGWTVIEARP